MKRVRFLLLLSFSVIALLAGCRSSRIIEVPPPSSSDSQLANSGSARGSVNVILETGQREMPDGVQSVRFRVNEVEFRSNVGQWTQRLSNRETVSATKTRRSEVPLLSTELAAVPYDSIAIHVTDVYVEYNAHAGGPLIPVHSRVSLSVDLEPDPASAQTIRLMFHPAQSIRADSAAFLWRFEPVLTVEED